MTLWLLMWKLIFKLLTSKYVLQYNITQKNRHLIFSSNIIPKEKWSHILIHIKKFFFLEGNVISSVAFLQRVLATFQRGMSLDFFLREIFYICFSTDLKTNTLFVISDKSNAERIRKIPLASELTIFYLKK